jgi:hypothetical protein
MRASYPVRAVEERNNFSNVGQRVQARILLAGRKLEWATHLAERGVGDQPQQDGQLKDQSSGLSRLNGKRV